MDSSTESLAQGRLVSAVCSVPRTCVTLVGVNLALLTLLGRRRLPGMFTRLVVYVEKERRLAGLLQLNRT